MADLASLSNEDLLKMYQPQTAAPSGGLSSMSNEQLMALYQPQQGAPAATPQPQIDPTDTANIVTMGSPHAGGAAQTAKDYAYQIADNATFGLAAKAKAGLRSALTDEGSYDELLTRYRKEIEEAGNRIGTGGQIASALVGGGGVAGGLGRLGLTVAGRLAPAAGIIPRTIAGAVEGAGYGAAYGAGHTDTGKAEDYAQNALHGGVTGAAFGAAAPAVLSGVSRAITPAPAQSAERLRQAQALQAAGVPVTAADRTGSGALAKLEDQTGKMPLGKLFADPAKGQMEAVTARAAERAGIPAGTIPTDKVLADTSKAVGGRIGNIQSQYHVPVDPPMVTEILAIANDIPLLEAGRQAAARSYLHRLVQAPAITPELASATRSQLRRGINAQNGPNGDKEYQGVLIDIRNALDDALVRTVQAGPNPGHVAELQQARQQYANLQVLQDALFRSGEGGQRGVLTPTALQAAQASSLGKAGYMQGRGDLTELAKNTSSLLRAPQDSGTASNVATMNPLKWAASLGGQALITNPIAQRYWGNQLLPQGAANEAIGPAVAGLLAARDAKRRKGLLSP